MLRRIVFLLAIVILFFFSSSLNLKAQQKYPNYQAIAPDFSEQLTKIEEKIDKLSMMNADATNREVLKKLDLILSSQAEIKDELNKIKVRATR